MKKILSLILVLAFAVALTGCGSNNKSERILYKDVKLSKVVDLGDYKEIPVDTSSDTFKEYYDEIVTSDIENYGLYVHKTEGTVADGDVVNIDYVGKKDGVAFEGGTDSGYDLEIGSGSFIDGFESGLVGKKIGDTVDLNLTFPEDYGNEELNGADVVFAVTINYVITDEVRKPEDYYSELEFEDLDAYTDDVTKRAVKDYLVDTLSANSEIKEYPEDEVNIIYEATKNTIESNLQSQYGMDLATYLSYMGQTEDAFKESMISEQIKPLMDTQLLMYAILDEEKISVTDEEITAEINEILEEIGNESITADYLKEIYGDYYFEASVVSEKVMDLMYENAKIS